MNPCPKTKPVRDKAYTAFIRSMPCLVCGKPSVCHHEPLTGHGMSSKGPDNESLPLCPVCHRERHDHGRYTFYQLYNIDWKAFVVAYQRLYKKEA